MAFVLDIVYQEYTNASIVAIDYPLQGLEAMPTG